LARGTWNGVELVPRWFVEELETKQTRGMKANYNGPNDGKIDLSPQEFPESPYGFLTWVNTDRDLFPARMPPGRADAALVARSCSGTATMVSSLPASESGSGRMPRASHVSSRGRSQDRIHSLRGEGVPPCKYRGRLALGSRAGCPRHARARCPCHGGPDLSNGAMGAGDLSAVVGMRRTMRIPYEDVNARGGLHEARWAHDSVLGLLRRRTNLADAVHAGPSGDLGYEARFSDGSGNVRGHSSACRPIFPA